MTFRNQKLTIRNVSNKDVRVFGRLIVKRKQTVEVFSKLDNISAEDIFREFSTSGDLYREVNVKGSLQIVSHNLSFAPPSTTQTASATDTLTLKASDGGLVNTDYDYDFIRRIFGDPDYKEPSSTVTMYVSTSGNDTTGDGSSSNPYRQPQRALEDIPDGAVGDFIIQCGAGTFEAPYFKGRPGNGRLTIIIVGSRSESGKIDLSNPSWSNVAGKNAQVRANIGAYAETVADGGYWMERLEDGIVRGSTVLASSTPNLDVIKIGDSNPSDEVAIHPFATVFDTTLVSGAASSVFWPPNDIDPDEESAFMFVGIDFNTPAAGTIENSYCEGCKVRTATLVRNCILHVYAASIIRVLQTVNGIYTTGDSAVGGLFLGDLQLQASQLGVVRSCVFRDPIIQLDVQEGSKVGSGGTGDNGLGGCDFEGGGICVRVGPDSYLAFSGDCSVSNNPTTFLDLDMATFKRGLSASVTGTVTGDAVILKNGSKAIEAKACFNSTLTSSGGSEIVVGSNSGINFSALPDNDYVTSAGAKNASSQGCFAN